MYEYTYSCPRCGHERTELDIRYSKLTRIINNRYFTYCPNCKMDKIPVDQFKIKEYIINTN